MNLVDKENEMGRMGEWAMEQEQQNDQERYEHDMAEMYHTQCEAIANLIKAGVNDSYIIPLIDGLGLNRNDIRSIVESKND